MRRPLALFVAVAAIMLVGSSCSSTLSDAASINYSLKGAAHNAHITRADLLSEVGKIVANKPFATWLKQNNFAVNSDVSTDTSVSAIWLSELIHQQAIDQLFAARRLHISPSIRTRAATDVVGLFPGATIFPAFDSKFRATLTDRQARTEAVLGSYTDTSDAAGQKFFNEHASQLCSSGREVSHILLPTQAAAQVVLARLKAGESFATLAEQESIDKQSGARGGALGCLTPGTFLPAFENAAVAAPFDTPTGPVHSKVGYHVILATHASYATERAQVLQALASQGQAAAQAAINAELKGYKVHLDPRFGTWGLKTNSAGQKLYQVTPPKPPNPSTRRDGTTTTVTTLPSAAPGAAPGPAPGSP